MAATGCNPLVAIQIALAGRAAEMVKQTPNPDLNRERVSRYLCVFISIILVFLINNRHKRFFIGDELAMVVSGHERGRTGKAIEATETVLTDSNRAECHFS
ncbi:MAG: hypothetical protein OXF88_13860 [Rhodobacteraceae bacterium]|nr:hypothetical protein [Paracoccaceae bacterium]